MNLRQSLILSVCAVSLMTVAPSVRAEESAAVQKAFSADQKAALEDFVRNFILDNPEVLMESVNRYRKNEESKRNEDSTKILKDNSAFLKSADLPHIGNPKGDITVVEFFDYNCGYCKRAMETMKKLAENDKNVRIVFMDYPILSPDSSVAAKWALAANKQGKYWEFHQAVLASMAPKDEENLTKIAKDVGLDVAKLKKDAEGKEVETQLAAIADFGHKLNVTGTPAFIIGNEILRGFMEYEGFKTVVDGARKKAAK